jgi:hypothetical protein
MAWLDHTTINMQPPHDFSCLHHSITDGLANFINYLQARTNVWIFHCTKYHAARAYLLLDMLNLEEIDAKN